MSIGPESPAGSQYLSSSHSSLNHSKRASSELSKTYKHASQLYLTRRLSEAYDVLQPVIRAPTKDDHQSQHEEESSHSAPIATAATSQRIKIWSLYITLLNAVVDLGPEEGKREFGSKEYGSIVRNVQTGDIWEQVIKDGYQGREGSVDAEVVYNLSNLLLAQAPNQLVNQSRLETYLSSSSANLDLDLSAHLTNSLSNGRRSHVNGTNTPKDLTSRIKILELFTLHVLPHNEEWEYAQTFINNSDILDEERREAFLQTVQELQEAKEHEGAAYTDAEEDYGNEQDYTDEENQNDVTNDAAKENPLTASSRTLEANGYSHRRTSSEVDYGIDQGHPISNGTTTKTATSEAVSSSKSISNQTKSLSSSVSVPQSSTPVSPVSTTTGKTQPNPSLQPSRQNPPSKVQRQSISKPSAKSKAKAVPSKQASSYILRRAHQIMLLFRTISANLSASISLRTLMFIFAILAMFSRREVRERVKRIVEQGWGKLRGTIGMGVKVSYI